MTTSPLTGLVFANEREYPYWTTQRDYFLAVDVWLYSNYEDKSLILSGGGVITLVGDTLSWSTDLYLSSLHNGSKITITAGSKTVTDGQVVYVTVPSRPISDQTLTLSVGTPATLYDIPIGRRIGTVMYLRDIGAGSGMGPDTLNDGYDNFLSIPAIVDIDNAQSQGDLRFKCTGNFSLCVDLEPTTNTADGFQIYDTSVEYWRVIRKGDAVLDVEAAIRNLNYSLSGTYDVAVVAGDATFTLSNASSLAVNLAGCTGSSDGFHVINGTDYVKINRNDANQLAFTATVQTFAVDSAYIVGIQTANAFTINGAVASSMYVTGANLTVSTVTSGTLAFSSAGLLTLSDGYKSGSTYSSDLVLSDSSAEWSTFESGFGEVSIFAALNACAAHFDHGALTGLSDDDHAQYALLAGRSGGQTLIGGTGTTDDLILRATSGVGASGSDIILQVGNAGGTEAARFDYQGNMSLAGSLTITAGQTITSGLGAAAGTILLASTAQTVDGMQLFTGTTSNSILICEYGDVAFDFQYPQQANPTLCIRSANQSTTEYIAITHDQTDGVITVGAGSIKLDGNVKLVADKAIYNAYTIGSLYIRNTTQTVDCPVLATGTTGNYWLMCEYGDTGFDFQYPQQTNPTLCIRSANQAIDEYGALAFNNFSIGGTKGSFDQWKSIAEEVTIPVGQGSGGVASTANLAPANSRIKQVVTRVTQAPGGGATTLDVGRTAGGNLDEYADGTAVALGTTTIADIDGDGVTVMPHWNTSASRITLTTNLDVTGTAMKVRIIVYYETFVVPTS